MLAEALAFANHDHTRCKTRIAAAVETRCQDRGLRLTPLRRRVLEILLEEHKAMGAYEVLAQLAAEGRAAHPPVAYRALDWLVAHGFAHKIERLNAFVACLHPDDGHRPAFLICRSCQSVAEAEIASGGPLGQAARDLGFTVDRWIIEAEGLCPACEGTGA